MRSTISLFSNFSVQNGLFMHIEVEQKHKVEDGWDLAIQLAGLGAKLGEPIGQTDQYFAHPIRDFAKTDEALRIRTVPGGSFITYKGPKLDTKTKTRRELELPLSKEDPDGTRFAELLRALGFTPVATVRKLRREFQIHYAGYDVQGAYDLVDRLGAFVELELIADDSSVEVAKNIVDKVAQKLDLGPSVTQSYLEMLLDSGYRLRPTK
jgi:adenylate cyclase class 2